MKKESVESLSVHPGQKHRAIRPEYAVDLAQCLPNIGAIKISQEGAEIVHDLNQLLPDELSGIADFIFNGSCLDTLFDPATAIKSMSKMLKPGGRIIHLEHGTAIQDAFLCYSPEWFFDFYATNNYDNYRNYICTFKNSPQNAWEVYSWKPFYKQGEALLRSACSLHIGDFINIVVSDKGLQSTDSRTPIPGSLS
jgi:SAM-dependent methyltransferase